MIKRRNRLPMRNAAGVELVAEALQTHELSQPRRREVDGFLRLRGPAHLDQGICAARDGREGKTFRRLF